MGKITLRATMKNRKTMRCPECDRSQSRGVFTTWNNFGRLSSIGRCPDCGTEFRLAAAGRWYALCALVASTTILIEMAMTDLLDGASRSAIVIPYSVVVIVAMTLMCWSFPYLVRLQRERH